MKLHEKPRATDLPKQRKDGVIIEIMYGSQNKGNKNSRKNMVLVADDMGERC